MGYLILKVPYLLISGFNIDEVSWPISEKESHVFEIWSVFLDTNDSFCYLKVKILVEALWTELKEHRK